MAIPIIGSRKARKQAEMDAAVAEGVQKAIMPALAQAAMQAQMTSGATYGINPSSPFNQTGPGGGYQPLPRLPGVFDSGFGPGVPLAPDALDPLTSDGRTLTRRTQYLVAANLQLVDRRIPWSVLKGLAEDVDVIQRCIQIVQDALVGLDWSWGFSPQIITQIMNEQGLTNSAKATAIAREKYGDELDRVQTFFDYPDKEMGFTFDTWLTDIIASHLTFDGVVISPSYNLGGELTSLSTIDTSCYSDDTEVLTDHGWKLFRDVDTVLDRFATRNMDTKEFEWQFATDYYEGPSNGEMYHFTSRTLDVLVTPNHRMLITENGDESVVRADELARTYKPGLTAIPATSSWIAPDLESFTFVRRGKHAEIENLDKLILRYEAGEAMYRIAKDAGVTVNSLRMAMVLQGVEMRRQHGESGGGEWAQKEAQRSLDARTMTWSGDDFAAFMGMYLSEGSLGSLNGDTSDVRHTRNNSRMVCISQVESSKGYQPFKELLERLPGIKPWRNEFVWKFGCKALADYLRPLGHSWEKYIPDEILNMSKRQLEIFWRFYMLGDGCYSNGRESISTVSKRMADGLQEIAQKLGYSSGVYAEVPTGDTVMSDGRVIKLENKRTSYRIELRVATEQRFDVACVEYDRNVYCVKVPNETLYVRRNGRPAWSCNTIKILLDNRGFIPKPPAPAYQQILYGFPRGEYQAEDMDGNGNIPNGYQLDQLAYYLRRPHASNLYGYSQVEECINIATIYMQRQAWLHAEYSHGVTPKMFIETAETENWTAEQLAYYERILNDQWSGQTQRRQQIMLGRPGMKPTQLKDVSELFKADYDNQLILQIGAKFGIPQSMLGIPMHSSIGGGAAGKQQSDQSEQFATDAMKNWLIGIINDMARRFMGVGPEITITATGGGNDDDDLTRAQADEIDVNTGIRTRNEIRAERGIPLMNEPEADQLGVTIATGVSFLSGALEAQQTAAALAAQPPAPPQTHTITTAPDGTVTETHGAAQPAANAHGGASVSVGTTSASVGNTAASVAPKANTDTKAPANVDAKDDARQPDAENETAKELAAFSKWAKTHVGRSTRDFQFTHVDTGLAKRLNDAARIGDLTVVKSLISDAKNASTVRVIDPYAHIPDDVKNMNRDAYPDVVVEKITLDYSGKPRSVETISSVHGDAPSVAQDAAKQSVADIVAERLSGDIERLVSARSELEKARSGV